MLSSVRFSLKHLAKYFTTGSAMASMAYITSNANCESDACVALNPKEWRSYPVSHVEKVTSNVSRVRVSFPDKDMKMGMSVASCMMVRAKIGSKYEARPYTPVSSNEEVGYLELVVKGYEQGKVSKHITSLKVGDMLEVKGPFKKYPYKPNEKKTIGMIAGGSGIAPMLQVIKEIIRNGHDSTKIKLLFANVKEDDIILRNELDALAYLYPEKLQVRYCLDQPPASWKGYSGFITKDMIEEYLPQPDENHLIMVCGPPPMMHHICGNKAKDKSQGELNGLLSDLKYDSTMVFKF